MDEFSAHTINIKEYPCLVYPGLIDSIVSIVSITEASKIAGITRSHAWKLCKAGIWPSIRISGKWFVPRSVAIGHKPRKRGLKMGQKINREKK